MSSPSQCFFSLEGEGRRNRKKLRDKRTPPFPVPPLMQSCLANLMSNILFKSKVLRAYSHAAESQSAEGTTRYNFIHSSFISFSSSSILHDLRRTRRRTGSVPRSQILSQKMQHPRLSIHCTRTASEPRAMHVWSVMDGLFASKKEQWS